MQITNVKAMVAKVLVAGFLAGAVVMAAPAKASAQEVVVRGYRGPAYAVRGYVAPDCAPGYVAVNHGPAVVDRFAYDRDLRRRDDWDRGQRRVEGVHDQFRHGSRGDNYR